MNDEPDFFLSTVGELDGLTTPRACWVQGRLRDRVRDDHMLVRIEPPLVGQKYGLGDKDISTLVISARHKGSSLFPINEWPSHVYVARVLDEAITDTLTFGTDQVEIIAWGRLFHTLDEANAAVMEAQR